MKLIIIGQIGSGKGTYASRMAGIMDIPHISTGDLFRQEIKKKTEIGRKIEEFVKAGKWCPDEITLELVERRLAEPDAEKGFIFDGFPRTIPQAAALEKITPLDAVILLKVPEEILLKRITSRRTCRECGTIYNVLYLKPKVEGKCDQCGGELYQRPDEQLEPTKQRMKEYERLTAPVVEFYHKKGLIREIINEDIETPPEPIVERILEAIGYKKE